MGTRDLSATPISIWPLEGLPQVRPGDDLAQLLIAAIDACGVLPWPNDILVVSSKIIAKAEGRFVDLDTITPSTRAIDLAHATRKDARLVEVILSQSVEVIRAAPNVLIVETKGGLILANAGVDQSNLAPDDQGRRVLLLPADPDASAKALKAHLDARYHTNLSVIIADSVGRPWRLGTVGLAIGAAGVPSLWDRRGETDLTGRRLEVTQVAFADAVAGAAVLAMGEGSEGRPAALVRGFHAPAEAKPASAPAAAPARGPVPMSARYVALSGGVGGAKLALGLAHILGERLSIIVNTGDDFEHLGLHISPDVDTTLYTLSGLVNPETGWGRRDETWSFMKATAELGGPQWFKLGDADLALHVERTRRLRAGDTLTEITRDVARNFGIAPHILPMSDAAVRTLVETAEGTLEFQHYFVREQCRPVVKAIRFEGASGARPSPEVLSALSAPGLAGIIICPSNPWLSVDPILSVPGLNGALRGARVPVVAVSPIIAGQAVKGPTAKIMRELGLEADAVSIAQHYAGLIDGFILDAEDKALLGRIELPTLATQTLMRTLDDRIQLAKQCLTFCEELRARRQ